MLQNYKLFYIFAWLKYKIYLEKDFYPNNCSAFDDSGIVATRGEAGFVQGGCRLCEHQRGP